MDNWILTEDGYGCIFKTERSFINYYSIKNIPRFDGTGPWSAGTGTGWGMGPCGAGMGWRRGGGFGRGFGRGRFSGYQPYQPQITKKEEKGILEDDVTDLEEELKAIKTRLSELKGRK